MTKKNTGDAQHGKSGVTAKPTSGSGEDTMDNQQFDLMMTAFKTLGDRFTSLEGKVDKLPTVLEVKEIIRYEIKSLALPTTP